jgi:hypothetical protein
VPSADWGVGFCPVACFAFWGAGLGSSLAGVRELFFADALGRGMSLRVTKP